MPRRMIVKREDIYKMRAESWSTHYQHRKLVKEMSNHRDVTDRIVRELNNLPSPQMGIDGGLLDYPIEIRREYLHGKILPEALSKLVCIWYWSEDDWMDFVRLFQSLPDVYEDYYWRYQPELDRVVLFPVSTNAPRGRSYGVLISGSPKVHLSSKPVDKYVDNSPIYSSPKVHLRSYPHKRLSCD
jgi:hypothetical protein